MLFKDTEKLLNLYSAQADKIRDRLTLLLEIVSAGKVPSDEAVSDLFKDMTSLQTQYNEIYESALSTTEDDVILQKGDKVSIYIEVISSAQNRLLNGLIEQAKDILTKFITVKSKSHKYESALKTYQVSAEDYITQLSELTIADIKDKTDAMRVFLTAMEVDPKEESERWLEIAREVETYYSLEVLMGLTLKEYYLPLITDENQILDFVTKVDITQLDQVGNHSTFVKDTEYAEDESISVDDGKEVSECNSLTKDNNIADNSMIKNDIEEVKEDQTDENREPDKGEQIKLKAVNRLKTGKTSAASFRNEITKMAKVHKEVRTILPLLTNLGILTKDQSFLFGVCMDCFDESDQNKEAISIAIEVLTSKGYLACFEYEEGGTKVAAYCLSDYCISCMRKESLVVQLKGFWSISLGYYKFVSDREIEREIVKEAIAINASLLKYLYSVKNSLSKEELESTRNSIKWRNGYYRVAVFYEENKYTCRLVNPGEIVNDYQEEKLLLCDELHLVDLEYMNNAKNIFVLKHGLLSTLDENQNTPSFQTSNTVVEKTIDDIENESLESSIDMESSEIHGDDRSEGDDNIIEHSKTFFVMDDNSNDRSVDEEFITTPIELLQKNGIPSDKEFCYVISSILQEEVTTQEQLKSAIVNAALLAKGAELVKGCEMAKHLSLQLRLATNVLLEDGAYTSEILTMAFPNIEIEINTENEALVLAAYLYSMLTPAMPFDYGLMEQTTRLFRQYEDYFTNFNMFKKLFNKLNLVRDVSASGFTPTLIASLGTDAERENFLTDLKKKAQQYLVVQSPKARMKTLPVFYADCFGKSSDLYECMMLISKNVKDEESLDLIKMILVEFCEAQDDNYVLNDERIKNYLNNKWNEKNDYKLTYDAYNQAFRQLKNRLEVMRDWIEHMCNISTKQHNIDRLKIMKNEILEIIRDIQKDRTWKKNKNVNILKWMLCYMEKYLGGELTKLEIYSDLLYTGVITMTDNGVPIMDKTMASIKFYEPWRKALQHITTHKRTAEVIKSEIIGDVIEDVDEEAGLKDNFQQLSLLGKFLKSEDEGYIVSEIQLKEAKVSADERTIRFKESLELAYTYNQINEVEKETLSGILEQYRTSFYDNKDYANWRRFLEALELQIHEYATGRKRVLRAKLDVKLKANAYSSLLIEADRLLEEKQNFAVVEEYITRFDSGETELEGELATILHDIDYFGKFLSPNIFNELFKQCQKNRGRSLKNFGWDYIENLLPEDWTKRLKENSMNLINSWPYGKNTVTKSHMMTLFKCLGFNVTNAEKRQGTTEEMFQIYMKPTPKSMADYRHPIAAFGTKIKNIINVINLFGTHTERQLVDTISSLNLGGISIVLIDQALSDLNRRYIAEIFHKHTTGLNPFLLIDRVLLLFLAMHQETERLPALLKCTLPYTTYQPFVRDGGSTSDEMFCGRSQELATIIDLNGACVVYGGRQLGKTALLERAESRCSKPDSKEYAVYSTIVRIDTESEVVETLIADIDKKTNGNIKLTKCSTIKQMCAQLGKLFREHRIATMHLLIDEVDCFLAAIADVAYRPIQPLVDLKRETKNNFKFVLTGLHNVCRAQNATKENGVFGQLGTPLCIKPLSPTDALKLLSKPLNYLGFQIDRYPHLETILTNTNYYPGILQFFGYMLVETLSGQYAKYYRAADGNPPFTLQDEQLGAVMNSSDLNKSIKDKFRWSLELDARYFMIARSITMLYHLYDKDRAAGSWMGFPVDKIREIADDYAIHCLENETEESFLNLLDEMVEMGILSQPEAGHYRLRRSSFVDIIGENIDILENDIVNHNEVTA